MPCTCDTQPTAFLDRRVGSRAWPPREVGVRPRHHHCRWGCQPVAGTGAVCRWGGTASANTTLTDPLPALAIPPPKSRSSRPIGSIALPSLLSVSCDRGLRRAGAALHRK